MMFFTDNKDNKDNIIDSIYRESYHVNISKISLSSNTFTFIYMNRLQVQKCIYSDPKKYYYLIECVNI
jgi:hypothetical protein